MEQRGKKRTTQDIIVSAARTMISDSKTGCVSASQVCEHLLETAELIKEANPDLWLQYRTAAFQLQKRKTIFGYGEKL